MECKFWKRRKLKKRYKHVREALTQKRKRETVRRGYNPVTSIEKRKRASWAKRGKRAVTGVEEVEDEAEE